MKNLNIILSLVFVLVAVTSTARADIVLSTTETETLGGVEMRDGDLVNYNFDTDTGTIVFNEDLFSHNEDVDALHILDNGNFVISTKNGATLGGLTFEDGDLVEYNASTGTASLFFDEDLFSGNEDIDALSILANGNLVLSTTGSATLGGLSFGRDDLIAYDPVAGTASLYFNGNAFTSYCEDIDAVHVLASGNILLSTITGATLGGLTFEDGDVVEYNPQTHTATIFFDEDLLQCNTEDVDAVYVPEPCTIALLGMGGIGLIARKRE